MRSEIELTGLTIPHADNDEDYAVADAVSSLSGFDQETLMRHRVPGNYEDSARTVVVFHKDTLDKYPGDEVLWAASPDILVDYRINPTRFTVNFNEKIDPALVDNNKVQEEIDRLAVELFQT